jgi:glycine/D-amino acid oxidase-like deaminating enzyme/nitrite reductase/ring-hydroxylating ferredoxin subunit
MPSPDHAPLTRASTRAWGTVTTTPAPAEDPLALPDGPPVAATDVVVVGAGITGLTTALLLRRAGTAVTVVEAREPGSGTTGGSTGKATVMQGSHVQEIRSRHGDEVTAAYLAQHLAAQRWLAQEVGDDPEVASRRPAITYARGAGGLRVLEKEVEALGCGGIVPEFRDQLPELPFAVSGGIALEDQLQLHPIRHLEHLLAELRRPPGAGEGRSQVVTGWRVHDVSDGTPVGVTMTRGGEERVVHADRVVVATLLPFLDRGLLFARSEPTRSWCVAARLRGPAPTGMYLGVDTPTRSLRSGTTPDELVVGGNSHVTGRGGPTSARLMDLDRWTRRHFDVERIGSAWAAQDYSSADRLPWVGPILPTNDRVLCAAGFAKWGITGGTAAAMQLAAGILGASSSWPWHPWRGTPVTQVTGGARINAGVAVNLASGWGRGLTHQPVAAVPEEGAGRVERRGRHLCGISTVDGVTRERSAVCTHLGGVVTWNDAERSWDCPLHGSRFGADGEVLDGPAVDPLAET